VQQAAEFVRQVNRARNAASAQSLSDGAEACFSIQQHLDCVGQRVLRLCGLSPVDAIDGDLHEWLKKSLLPAWQDIAKEAVAHLGPDKLVEELSKPDRCLSPSDFGFHNALVAADGQLRFFDFEYAGWDDPAKLVCDFYWQQDLPAPRETKPILMSAVSDQQTRGELEKRTGILTPVYGIKWCCLVLNEFIADDRRRRDFAHSGTATIDRRSEQLAKARQLLRGVDQAR
jgi:hypothetical protein